VSPTPTERVVNAVVGHALRAGELTLVSCDGCERRISSEAPGPQATVVVNAPRAARRIVAGASLGMAQGYIAGEWDTPDIDAVLDLGLANLTPKPHSAPALLSPVTRAWHKMRDNDLLGSKRNIAYHYDLGNEFYRLWLDPTMAYSSALYAAPAEDISHAQVRKWDRMLDLLQLSSADHLLEIGCGWGSFAIHAAKQAGCRITGITLSEEQHAWATKAVAEEGLEGRVDIRLQDYRRVSGEFTAIASIEMFEAVGERWWPVFFRRLRELLAPGGAAAIQVITIDEGRFDDYRRNPDFIQRYIFPGGMLPSPQRFAAAASAEQLRVGEPHFFGRSYAETLVEWRRRFEDALPEVFALGFDERFARMWRYYLAYCRAGFSAGSVDVMQVRLER